MKYAKHLTPPALPFVLGAVIMITVFFGSGPGPSLGLAGEAVEDAEDYVASILSWRADRETRLRSDDGWLTVAGLAWLDPGVNLFGSGPENAVVFPPETCPSRGGVLRLVSTPEGQQVEIQIQPGASVLLNGEPVNRRFLAADDTGQPDILHMGRVRFWVIKRGDLYGIRMRDPESPIRREFEGIESYAVDPSYRVEARLARTPSPRELPVANVVGYVENVLTPGPVKFRLQGKDMSLHPIVSGPADSTFFFVFEDETSGRETYGGGRFLYARLQAGDRLVLDFNKAYNPPCAFSPYTTCSLPPKGNKLPLAVRAGEKAYQHD